MLLERFQCQAPPPEAVGGVERDRRKPRARVARDRPALWGTLGIQEGRLHHVFGVLMVPQLALDESDQPGAMLPIQSLDLGGHASYVPAHRGERNEQER